MNDYHFERNSAIIEGYKKAAFRGPFTSERLQRRWQITHTLLTKEV